MRTGILLAALLLQGCVNTTPKWDRQFGQAVRANVAAQVLDPAAAANNNPVTGIDGRAARATQDRYERSFAEPSANAAPALIDAMGTGK
jgi:type IV pilus biogenesis protein CpaD/CtpE